MTQDRDYETERTPDSRMQFEEMERKRVEGESASERGGPSPYDQASPDMPEKRVITKGEREKPGPTSADELAETSDSGVASEDDLLQTNQVDRSESVAAGAGYGGSMEDEELTPPFEDEEAAERAAGRTDSGHLGGGELHDRINTGASGREEAYHEHEGTTGSPFHERINRPSRDDDELLGDEESA